MKAQAVEEHPLEREYNHGTTEILFCAYYGIAYAVAGGVVTACLGGVGCIPGLFYGIKVGRQQAAAQWETLSPDDMPLTKRQALARTPERIAEIDEAWEKRYPAGESVPEPVDPRTDPLYKAMKQLGFTVAEAADAVSRIPPGAKLPDRLRAALRRG